LNFLAVFGLNYRSDIDYLMYLKSENLLIIKAGMSIIKIYDVVFDFSSKACKGHMLNRLFET
jgi:hypothetical protein